VGLMTVQYSIRRARKADGPSVFEWIWSARTEIPLKDQFHTDLTKEWLANECRRKRVWVADVEQVIVAALYIHFDQFFYLVVDHQYRRLGIARALLTRGKRPRRWCKIAPGNKAVRGLLEREGFIRTDRLTAGDWIAYEFQPRRALPFR
jgi:ribosomal protein S18 acetylase RimI-like enzyme